MIIGSHGVEASTIRTTEQFSLCDYINWGEEIRHTLSTDWPGMRQALLRITEGEGEDVERAWHTWELGGVKFEGEQKDPIINCNYDYYFNFLEFRQVIHYTMSA